jgi:hypothetical protein
LITHLRKIISERFFIVKPGAQKESMFLKWIVNKQNRRFWAAENPRELHQRPLHTAKVSVWCGISQVGITGPYFFEEEGATVTVTSERYVKMLCTFLLPQLRSLRVNMEETWLQQDEATAHTARSSMTVV